MTPRGLVALFFAVVASLVAFVALGAPVLLFMAELGADALLAVMAAVGPP
jgi:hypothetical protein